MWARAARRRGDIDAARTLIGTCLDRLPGRQEFAEFAAEVGADLGAVLPRPDRRLQAAPQRRLRRRAAHLRRREGPQTGTAQAALGRRWPQRQLTPVIPPPQHAAARPHNGYRRPVPSPGRPDMIHCRIRPYMKSRRLRAAPLARRARRCLGGPPGAPGHIPRARRSAKLARHTWRGFRQPSCWRAEGTSPVVKGLGACS